jgi:hypothetical protein
MRGAILALALLTAIPAQAAGTFDARILSAHNRERAALAQPSLAWSDALAGHAAVWARHLAQLGRLEHSAIADRPGEGENLWLGTAGAYTPEEMVQGWADEKHDFADGIFPDVSRSGHWEAVGHYSQMIWAKTTQLGCAKATAGGWDILVCRYSPPGNLVGEKPY